MKPKNRLTNMTTHAALKRNNELNSDSVPTTSTDMAIALAATVNVLSRNADHACLWLIGASMRRLSNSSFAHLV